MDERKQGSATRDDRPTLSDVAQATGVSVATASRVLSGVKGVSPPNWPSSSVRRADALGYQARSAGASRSSRTLGVIVARVASSFFGTLIEAIEEVATRQGYDTHPQFE